MDKDKLELWDEIRQRGFKDILMFHMLFFHYEEEKHNFNQRHYKITFSPTIRWFGPRSGHPLVEKLTGYTRTSKAPYKCENLVFLRRHTHTRSHIHKPPYLSGGQQPLRENSCRLTCTIVPSALPVWGACVVWIQWGVREITAAVRQTLHHRDREWSDNNGTNAHNQLAPSLCLLTAFICGCHYAADCVRVSVFRANLLEMFYSIFQQQHDKCWK